MTNKNKTGATGTYVGLRVLQPACDLLYQHCKNANIPVKKSTFDRRLHTTVLYSRNHHPDLETAPSDKYIAKITGYAIFGEQEGMRILVAKLHAPAVVKRHNFLMAKYGATHDYPDFNPHISLCYDFNGDIDKIPPFTHHIILGDEYTEDLDLAWKE